MTTFIRVLAIILYLAGIGVCIYFIGGTELTPRESALLSVVLTIFSILASWTVSHLYSESQHARAIKEVKELSQANLKTYARKAAEKVNNLSNQLGLLSAYLEKELATTDYDNVQEELNAKEERIESAVHIINALKSVNDTALSDWEGVITDELEQQRAEKQEQEEELEDLLARSESLVVSLEADAQTRGDNTLIIRREMDSLRRELRFLASRVGVSSKLHNLSYSSKNTVETACPVCKSPLTYRQKRKHASIKAVKCLSCESRLISRYDKEKGFVLELRRPTNESFNCPSCAAPNQVELDQVPSSVVTTHCNNCQAELRVTRASDGIRVRLLGNTTALAENNVARQLTEEIIERVRNDLPPQPWPKGIHKTIAAKLNLSNHVAISAINELIRRGVFNPQVDGRLYVPAADSPSTKE